MISRGSNVIVDGCCGVDVARRVLVTNGAPGTGVVVASTVLMTKKSGVKVAGRPKDVTVGAGEFVGMGVAKNGIDEGRAVHPARSEMRMTMTVSRFMNYPWRI